MRLPPGREPDFQLAEVGPMVAWPEPLPQTVERRTGPARRLLCKTQRRRSVAAQRKWDTGNLPVSHAFWKPIY